VEVDDAAALEFGDLGEGGSGGAGQLADADAELAGEDAAQGDGEAAPQFGGVSC